MVDARALFERVIGTFTPDKARPIWETWANYEYNFGDLSAADKLEKRIAEVYPDGASIFFSFQSTSPLTLFVTDLPMRRFAQRHVYSNHDAIAIRDLGWMPSGSGSSNGSLKHDNGVAPINSASTGSLGGVAAQKRPAASPDRGRSAVGRSVSQDLGPPPPKRAREMSPPPRDRDRDRRERERDRRDMPPPPRRRYGSPDWGRGSPPRRGGEGHPRGEWDRDGAAHDDRSGVPGLTTFFLNQLPPSSTFDGMPNAV